MTVRLDGRQTCCNPDLSSSCTVQQRDEKSSRKRLATTCPLVSPSRNRGWGQFSHRGAGKFKATTLGPRHGEGRAAESSAPSVERTEGGLSPQ